jgi:eukaryotic-like serine/threonine-protein kinase
MTLNPPRPKKFGRYLVEEEIGDGAMGRVYRCSDPLMKRLVAVKTVKSEYLTRETAEEYLRRFRREAQAAGRLSHPSIVAIYDVGETWFVMEYLEGRTLSSLLAERGRLPLDEALGLFGPLADALDYAHRSGIVHRDIKPGNVMVLSDGRPKLMDFGVARLDSSLATASGHFFGSPSYMAPEQVSGGAVTERADLFSFAVLAYEVLTGRRPFEGESITAVMYKVVHEDPPPPRQWDFELPMSYDLIFRKALAKAPEHRFKDAASMVATLAEKDIDDELAALTEVPPTTPLPPRETAVFATETTDLGVDTARRARRSQERASWLALAALLALGTFAGLREWAQRSDDTSTATAPATFRVETEPAGARVWLDEKEVGLAPVSLPVSGGRHKVRVAIDGYAPAELTMQIVPGTAPPPLRFVLEPITMRLTIAAKPAGATVTVDGRLFGEAPIDAASLPIGMHEIRIEKRGFQPYVYNVEGAPGETVELAAVLTPLSSARAAAGAKAGAAPAVPPLAEGTLVPFDTTVTPPTRIAGNPPEYPDQARRLNLLGTVKVEMIVDEKGEPTNLRVVESAGEILDRAVSDAVRGWRYDPAHKDGVKVKLRWSYTHRYQK